MCAPALLEEHAISSPQDIARLPLLHMKSRQGAWADWFEACGAQFSGGGGMTFEQFTTVAQACTAGLGVALLPIFLAQAELGSGQIVKAIDRPVMSRGGYYFVVPKRAKEAPALAAFRDWLLAEAHSGMTG